MALVRRLALWLVFGALMGLLIGRPTLLLAVFLALYLVWHGFQMVRLERWLRGDGAMLPPRAPAPWSDIYDHFYRLKRSERGARRQLVGLLKEFRDATAALPDGTVILDQSQNVQWFNRAAERLLGLRHPVDRGAPLTNVVRHPDLARWLQRGDDDGSLELPSPRDTQRTLTLRLIPYARGQCLLLVRDTSHFQHLERVRRDFVANVSHELRTPLTVVTGYLESLSDDAPADWEPMLEEMRRQAGRMDHILEDLLALSRLETANQPAPAEPVDVSSLAASLEREAQVLSDGAHTIELDIDPELDLLGERDNLRSAFSNLVTNAIRYTPEDGRIAVRWYALDNGACFAVEDNGHGIPAHHIPRLTERFYRVSKDRSRRSGGTGLGLSIVKHVLNCHEAQLEIDSKLGKGSRFVCRFPESRVVRHSAPATVTASRQSHSGAHS